MKNQFSAIFSLQLHLIAALIILGKGSRKPVYDQCNFSRDIDKTAHKCHFLYPGHKHSGVLHCHNHSGVLPGHKLSGV